MLLGYIHLALICKVQLKQLHASEFVVLQSELEC
jgi:hypothetical protein